MFEHLFPDESLPNLATETFSFTQGSSRVSTRIENDDIVISVPLARLPDGGKAVAALRFVLTKVSSPGQLFQPRLRGADVHLEFRDRLSRINPVKMLEVLRRMPFAADSNDDWLIGEFGALPLERADINALDDAEAARSDAIWRAHWHDVEELLKESQRKRSMFFLNEVTAYALHRIRYVLPLGGFLGSRLSESSSTFNDSEQDPQRREATLARCAKDMKAVSADELRKNLGHATYAISPHSDGTPSVLSQYIGEGNYMTTVEQFKDSGKSFEAALGLISTYNYLLGRFSWPEAIEADLQAGLSQSSGKSWRDAANVLFEHASELVAKFADEQDEDGEEDDQDGDREVAGDAKEGEEQ